MLLDRVFGPDFGCNPWLLPLLSLNSRRSFRCGKHGRVETFVHVLSINVDLALDEQVAKYVAVIHVNQSHVPLHTNLRLLKGPSGN